MIALILATALGLYDSGRYDEAAAAFQAERQHYNAGNAHFKAGRVGRAVAAYSRAFERMPRDADVRHNLAFALRRAGEDLAPEGVPPLLFYAFHALSEREAAGLFWLAWWAALVLAGLRRRQAVPAAVLCAVLGLWWGALRWSAPDEPGVIVAATAEVRSGPGDRFPVSFTAPEGRRVEVLERSGEWLEIGVLKEGARGWTRAANVETL